MDLGLLSWFSPSKNISDPGESPAIKIKEVIVNPVADIRAYDPFVISLEIKVGMFTSGGSIEGVFNGADSAFFLVDHGVFRSISMDSIKNLSVSPVVVDGKTVRG